MRVVNCFPSLSSHPVACTTPLCQPEVLHADQSVNPNGKLRISQPTDA